MRHSLALLSIPALLTVVVTGCGASAKPPPSASQADRMKAVVRTWNANLNAQNNALQPRLFSYPAVISLMAGPYGCYCLTPAAVMHFHTQLLCSVKILSITVRGHYATAVFGHFGNRQFSPSKCLEPPGARTGMRFTIVRGKITVLKQLWWKPPGRAVIRAPGR